MVGYRARGDGSDGGGRVKMWWGLGGSGGLGVVGSKSDGFKGVVEVKEAVGSRGYRGMGVDQWGV